MDWPERKSQNTKKTRMTGRGISRNDYNGTMQIARLKSNDVEDDGDDDDLMMNEGSCTYLL